MKIKLTKKILAALLAAMLIFSSLLSLVGCNAPDEPNNGENNENAEGGNGGDSSEGGDGEDYRDKIHVPEYKEYDRDTVKFKDITYSRPDIARVNAAVAEVTEKIEKNEISFDEQITAVRSLEEPYSHVLTMYSFANIYNSKDSSVKYWNDEYSYVTANYPSFAEALEDMFVAAANSPHAERFEEEYFGDGLIEEYKDGGNFTDNMIKLWESEEKLEAEYSSLSTATVKVDYRGVNDTVDNILSFYRTKYGENSPEYSSAYSFCMSSYQKKVTDISSEILVKLIRVRKLIADELGYDSYMTYAYETHGRDYTAEEMKLFLEDITEYVVPVYSVLNYYVFSSYFQTNKPEELRLDQLINKGYDMLLHTDEELADIFAFMLQFELHDIEKGETNRKPGAFTTYLHGYEAPFIFITADGTVTDYTTLFHEFGHFCEQYINGTTDTSLDQQEVSSQGLEYLMLHYLDGYVSERDAQYIKFKQLSSALEVLVIQGFYAKFEELAYAIPFEQISKESLDGAVVSAAEDFGLNTEYLNDISVVMIPHIFMYPFYVQSYCTSVVPALELYFTEKENEGEGLTAYLRLLDFAGSDYTFVEAMENAGLTSPFEKDILRKIADSIYFEIVGKHYYKDNTNDNSNAA